MEKTTILDTESAALWYYPDKRIIHNQFNKYVYGNPYRDFLNEVTKAFQKYRAQKLLSDDRKNSGISKDDQEWGNTDWFPRTKAAGWKYWAIVQPENSIGQLTMKRVIVNITSQGITAEVFTDPKKAMEWLEKQK
jgi:hypothetical protein